MTCSIALDFRPDMVFESDLVNALRMLRHYQVNVTAVIISSKGAVYSQSLKDLRAILHCHRRETHKLGRRMSDAAIPDSLKIWQQYARMTGRGSTGEKEEEALIDQEGMEILEMEENERDKVLKESRR
jgi:hypothetical protein